MVALCAPEELGGGFVGRAGLYLPPVGVHVLALRAFLACLGKDVDIFLDDHNLPLGGVCHGLLDGKFFRVFAVKVSAVSAFLACDDGLAVFLRGQYQ